MIESIILLYCLPLDDYKFRDHTEIKQYANYLTVRHYPDEHMFDINGLAKAESDDNCYWISIEKA